MNRKERRAALKQGGATPGAASGLQRVYDEAHRLHSAGQFADAERLFRQILAMDPRHGHSLHFLSEIARRAGRLDAAVELANKAIAINGGIAAYHYNLANILRDRNAPSEAVASYRRAIALNPAYPEAHNNLGLVLQTLGNTKEAADHYGQAIAQKPDFAEAHSNLGNILKERGKIEDAAACYRRALALRPSYPEAEYNLGVALKTLGHTDEAIASYRRAIAMRPSFVEAYNNLGVALKDQGKLDEALDCYGKVLGISAGNAEAHANMGNTLKQLGRSEEALGSFKKAITFAPGDAEAHSNMGNALRELGRGDEAVASFRKALTLNPDAPETLNNLAVVMQDMARIDEAIAAFEAAVAAMPENAVFHWNLSLAQLVAGDFARGWAEHEWRLKTDQHPKRDFGKPAWDGSDIRGLTILLHEEQGAGDSIQFIRYARLVKERGAQVIFECRPELAGLLGTAPGIDRLIVKGHKLPDFARQVPLVSLPLLFGTDIETIPDGIPYLAADTRAVETWRGRLPEGGPKIGVVWRGNPIHKNDRRRSIPAAVFQELCAGEQAHWLSLQKDGRPEELAALNSRTTVHDLGPQMGDWADTAAMVSCLDLVITVDTGVAHVAGALGKPVWLLIPFSPDWRWLLDRTDSPWYPTARLFRQPAPGDWGSVFTEVRTALETLNAPSAL